MPLLDLVPVISAIIGIVGISFKAGKILQKLDNVIELADKLDKRVISLEHRVTVIETKVDSKEKGLVAQ